MPSSTPNKKVIYAAVVSFALGAVALLLYALQFSALSFRLLCERETGNCTLSRQMVIGGEKTDVIPISQVKEADVSFHSHTQNVWLVTERDRFPIGSFSSDTTEANTLMNSIESFLHDVQQEKFEHYWPAENE